MAGTTDRHGRGSCSHLRAIVGVDRATSRSHLSLDATVTVGLRCGHHLIHPTRRQLQVHLTVAIRHGRRVRLTVMARTILLLLLSLLLTHHLVLLHLSEALLLLLLLIIGRDILGKSSVGQGDSCATRLRHGLSR